MVAVGLHSVGHFTFTLQFYWDISLFLDEGSDLILLGTSLNAVLENINLKIMGENHLPQGSVALEEKLFPVYGRKHSQNSLQHNFDLEEEKNVISILHF